MLPLTAGFDFTAAAPRERLDVRLSVFLAFLDERIEIRVKSPVMDPLLVVVFGFLLDGEAVRILEAGDHIQDVPAGTQLGRASFVPYF